MRHRTPKQKPTYDVCIVGAGIMGCSSAWKLARAGLRVVVLEKSVPGAEASSAAAGILGAEVEAHEPGPLSDLCRKSAELYPAFAKALAEETDIDVEFRKTGVLRVADDAKTLKKLQQTSQWQRTRVRSLKALELSRLEPQLSSKLKGGVLFPSDGRIDPKRLLRALHLAAAKAGVEFRSGAYVQRVATTDDRVEGVALEDGTLLRARSVVIAAGSWTTLVEGTGLRTGSVVPARGQILELEATAPPLTRVVFGPGAYLVPRDDGRVLVGSTLEFVGYRREVTAGAVRTLLAAAIELVPTLEHAKLTNTWSNFRPYTPDELPIIGAASVRGLILATGHYRNGILLAPITAEIVASLVLGKKAPLDLAAFRPDR